PGGGQEQGRRGRTEAFALIAAFGAAAEAAGNDDRTRLQGLVDALEAGLKALAPDVVIFGAEAERVGSVVNFAIPGLKSATAMMALDLQGVSVSSGSACSSGKVSVSHVLFAMGVAPELAECALRVSFGWNSTEEDATAFLSALETILARQKRSGQAA